MSRFELLVLILLDHAHMPETVTCRWLTALTERDWSLRTATNIITFQARIGLKLTGRNKFGKIHEVS